MALPAGRYGVTKNQLLKIKKLPMNTIKLIEELTEKFNLLGTAAFKNSTSVVTESSDLVESGAVKDIVGWGNKNLCNYNGVNNVVVAQCKNGVTYTFSLTSTGHAGVNLKKNDSSGNLVAESITSEGRNSVTFTADSDFNLFMNGYGRDGVAFTDDVSDLQLEVGSTATAYEPYHASVEESLEQKCDNSVIGTVEGANASKTWSVGEHFIKDGQFKEVTQPIANDGEINSSNTVDKPITDLLTELEKTLVNDSANGTTWTFPLKRKNNTMYTYGLLIGSRFLYHLWIKTPIESNEVVIDKIFEINENRSLSGTWSNDTLTITSAITTYGGISLSLVNNLD